jgi:hypothetical protein
MVAMIAEDPGRHRYRILHRLFRANSLGEWTQALDDVLAGSVAKQLTREARLDQQQLTKKCAVGEWQFEAVSLLDACIRAIDPRYTDTPTKVDARRWFATFSRLRNDTRGHGAIQSHTATDICRQLEVSIRTLIENMDVLKRPYAYIHTNLSGRCRITSLSNSSGEFDKLRQEPSAGLSDGVYLFAGGIRRVELIFSNPDADDFFLPNGNFRDNRFELLSYISGNKVEGDGSSYLTPPSELPISETHGLGLLDVQGQCFGNVPPHRPDYVKREALESELTRAITNDRHPVVTLSGRGGIGKTWLALSVLHHIMSTERYDAVVWFSARDIDLLPEGPKQVRQQVLDERDIALEFARLMQPADANKKEFDARAYFESALTQSPTGGPLLFVFDNFETVRDPSDLYSWMDTFIRNPNKILITTRYRSFKGDYPVVVGGMTQSESEELISASSIQLGIEALLTDAYRETIFRESEGHPYVMKVLLGEVAKSQRAVPIERIIASKDNILDALFERTYDRLSPVAQRVFLAMCNWRSVIPQLALEAVLLRPGNERVDVPAAVEELWRSSFVEVTISEEEDVEFLSVPLTAWAFGKRKLSASPLKTTVEADTAMLHAFGSARQADIRHGIRPRIERLFRFAADRVSRDARKLDEFLPVLEFVAGKYAPAWLLLASLHEESGMPQGLAEAKTAIRRYLESDPDPVARARAWKRLADLCQATSDGLGEVHALVEMSQVPRSPFSAISYAANRVSSLFRQESRLFDTVEKSIVVRKLADVMHGRISEGDAIDCSRLAWLYLNLRDQDNAATVTRLGLQQDSTDVYCRSLATRLGILQ